MTRFLIFLFPAIFDVIIGTFFYVPPIRIEQSGAEPLLVSLAITCWAISYMISNQVIGFFVTPKNAPWMLIGSSIAMLLLTLCFIVFPGLGVIYVWMTFAGIIAAFFFAPFQTFMKEVDSGNPYGIVRSTGLYTFSWSTGLACGPFISAFLWENINWQACFVFSGILALITAIGVFLLKKHAEKHIADNASQEKPVPEIDYTTKPDLAWLGWLTGGVGVLLVNLLRGVLPDVAEANKIGKWDQGMIIALLCFIQALTGLALCRSKTWMYRPVPVALFGLCGIASMTVFGVSTSAAGYYLAAFLFGIYAGGFFFYLVFHSLVHPEKSTRYVSINETVVGAAAIGGTFLGGLIAQIFDLASPFYFSIALAFIIVTFQVLIHTIKKKKT